MAAKHAYAAGQFFEGYPRPFAIYKKIKKHLESPGPVKTEAAKTQVGFGTKNRFAWLWLPQKWAK